VVGWALGSDSYGIESDCIGNRLSLIKKQNKYPQNKIIKPTKTPKTYNPFCHVYLLIFWTTRTINSLHTDSKTRKHNWWSKSYVILLGWSKKNRQFMQANWNPKNNKVPLYFLKLWYNTGKVPETSQIQTARLSSKRMCINRMIIYRIPSLRLIPRIAW
jgi:hypothetical protein